MASETLHFRCQSCGQVARFQGNAAIPACTACGLTNDEGNYKMQEELARMFNKNMAFNASDGASQTQSQQAPSPPATYSISQHYHHSSHLVNRDAPTLPVQAATSPPTSAKFRQVLVENGIDPSELLTAQLILFEQANQEQRGRLIELWRISRPQQARVAGPEGSHSTSLERETGITGPMSQTGLNSQGWQEYDVDMDQQAAGPYIQSGYSSADSEQQRQAPEGKETHWPPGKAGGNSYQQAFDPAFESKEWWRDFIAQQPMELQYGMYIQMNQFRSSQEDENML